MKWQIAFGLCLLQGLLVHTPAIRAEEPAPMPEPAEVKQLLEKLDSDDFEVRKEAAKKLKDYGAAVLPELRAASRDGSLQVKAMVNPILKPLEIDAQLSPRIKTIFPKQVEAFKYGGDEEGMDLFGAALDSERAFPQSDMEFLGRLAIKFAPERGEGKWGQLFMLMIAVQQLEGIDAEVIELLKHEKKDIRMGALLIVRWSQIKAAIPTVLPWLKSEDEDIRKQAALTLADLNVPEALPVLLKGIEEQRYGDAADAMRVLQQHPKYCKAAAPALLTALKNSNIEDRRDVAWLLGASKSKEVFSALLENLKSEDPKLVAASIFALRSFGDKTAVPEILPFLKSEEAEIRVDAFGALAALGAPEAGPEILAVLKGAADDPNALLTACGAAAQMHLKEATPDLIRLLKSQNGEVQRTAADALGKLGAQDAAKDLALLLDDKNEMVLGSAITALGRLKSSEGLPKIMEIMNSKGGFALMHAVTYMGTLKVKESIPRLLQMLDQGKPFDQGAACLALAELGAREAIPKLLEMIDLDHWNVRISAMHALAHLDAREAIPKLLPYLKSRQPRYCKAAASALARLKAQEAVPGLVALLKHEEEDVRARALCALERLKAKSALPQIEDLAQHDESEDLRRLADTFVGCLNEKPDVGRIRELLKNADKTVVDLGCALAGEFKLTELRPDLEKLLEQESTAEAAKQALEALGK